MTFSAMGKSSEQRTLRLLSNMTSVDINFEGRGRLMEEQQFTAAITFSYLKKKKKLVQCLYCNINWHYQWRKLQCIIL